MRKGHTEPEQACRTRCLTGGGKSTHVTMDQSDVRDDVSGAIHLL